jgi:GTP-binding protein
MEFRSGVSAGAEIAIEESDVILFVVDAQVGAQSEDEAMVDALRKSKKMVFLVANKVDSAKEESEALVMELRFRRTTFCDSFTWQGKC